jgi:hypothetical protein
MSKLAVGLLVAGILATIVSSRGEKPDQDVLAYGEAYVAVPQAESSLVYTVTSSSGASCRIVSESNGNNRVGVKPNEECADVFSGLDRVTQWTKGERGQDVLKDASGNAILVVGPSDGFAYEAVSADGAQISFALSEV